MKLKIFTTICWIMISFCAAYAQAPKTVSYQGYLKDAGVPIEGNRNLTFNIYASPFDVTPIWTESINNVPFTSGNFSVILGKVTALSFTPISTLYLGIQVNGGAEISPRTELTGSLYSLGLALPHAASISSSSPALSITNSGSGNAITAVGKIQATSFQGDGSLLTNLPVGGLSLNAANIFVGNGSNVAAGVALSGDATISNTGILTIGTGSITSAKISDGTLVNADISTGAAIAGSKIAPDFGTQNITTTGTITGASFSGNGSALTSLNASNLTGTVPTARLDVGTTANKLVQLDGSAKLPAVDGSLLTNLNVSGLTAGNATKLATARTIAGTSFDGSANVQLANKFIVQGTADAGLSAAQFLGSLGTGIVKNTTSTGVLSIATAGTDFQAPINLTTLGSSGPATFVSNTLNIPNYTGTTYSAGTGLTLSTNTFSVNSSQSISTLSNLTSNGLIRTTGGTGALSIASPGTDYLAPALTSANIFVGNGSNVAAGVPLSGDASISNTGALTIGSGSITTAKILDGTIANADISTSAAIAGSKIAPDFGTQNITTTGTITGASFSGSGSALTNLNASNLTGTVPTARLDVGTTANKIVQLDAIAKLPAVDGSQLTNLNAAGLTGTATSLTAGNATKLATSRTIAGTSFDGSANVQLANKFIVQGTADAGLSAAQFLGSLGTGLLKNTTGTGVLSIGIAGTDYLTPTGNGSGLTNLNASNIATGTVATARLDVGTTANKVVQLDGSARLPAVDGSQLTNLPATSPFTTSNFIPKGNGSTLVASLLFDNGTNVGIGTTSPTTAKLVIAGTAGAEGLDLSTTDQYANLRVLRNSNGSTDKDMYVGFNSGATSSLHLFSNNGETMTVKSGRVGVNNTSPSQALDVTGNLEFSGALMPNNQSGTSGQVLTSSGAGAPTWTTPTTNLTNVSSNFQFANGAARTLLMAPEPNANDAQSLTIKGSDASSGPQARNGGNVFIDGGHNYNASISYSMPGSIYLRSGGNLFTSGNSQPGDIVFQTGGITGSATNYATRMTIKGNGNVYIGSNPATRTLNVGGDIDATGGIYFGSIEYFKDGGGSQIETNANIRPATNGSTNFGTSTYRWNTVFATNGSINTSDFRLKKNIKNLDYGLSEILKLRPVSFNWKDESNKKTKLGLIAQETELVIPEVVHAPEGKDDFYGLNYADLIPVLIKSAQELNAKIETLEKENKALTQANTQLKSELSSLREKQEGELTSLKKQMEKVMQVIGAEAKK